MNIGIIAGGGALPPALAAAAVKAGHAVFIIGLAGNAGKTIERFPHAYISIGQIGRLFRLLCDHDCRHVVFIGSLRRPNLKHVRFDSGAVTNIRAILKLLRGGDDALLRRVAQFFEAKGFQLIGAHEIASDLLAPAGNFAKAKPGEEDLSDIKLGVKAAHVLGSLDIGQSVVVARGYVLAVEAAEGTDAMLMRCRGLNQWGLARPCGVLVKAPKPQQDLRLDMPVIGPRTVQLAAAAGLRGIAVAAGGVILAEPETMIADAGKLGLFLCGVPVYSGQADTACWTETDSKREAVPGRGS
jgi:hypothetical protein